MGQAIGLFVLGLVLLGLGGDSLAKGAAGLAQRLGVSAFMAGLLVLGIGTSLPELWINVGAVASDQTDLALGNAVGSNIVNFGLTLGIAALVAPLVLRLRLLAPMLVLLAVGMLALIVFGLDGVISRLEGVLLLLGYVVALAFVLSRGRRESAEVQQAVAAYALTQTVPWRNLLRIVVGAAIVSAGTWLVLGSTPTLGAAWHLSPLLMGLLPVAIATALPEIAAAIAAARRGQGDLVAGHVIGSSLFNALFIIGGMAAVSPLALPASFVRLELPAAIAFVLVLYPMLRGDLRIARGEGAILVVAFLGWIGLELALMS